jgi:hypothetical protein
MSCDQVKSAGPLFPMMIMLIRADDAPQTPAGQALDSLWS